MIRWISRLLRGPNIPVAPADPPCEPKAPTPVMAQAQEVIDHHEEQETAIAEDKAVFAKQHEEHQAKRKACQGTIARSTMALESVYREHTSRRQNPLVAELLRVREARRQIEEA